MKHFLREVNDLKRVKIGKISIIVILGLQLLVPSISSLSNYPRHEGRRKPSDSVDDPALVSIIEVINALKEKIQDSPGSAWKRPTSIRKFVMLIKLNVLKRQVAKNNSEAAYDKMVQDIKPKLTTSWVINEELQAEFGVDCDNILAKIEALTTPDIDPPVIILTPDQIITDGDAIGGFVLDWEITDASGISDATVELNCEVIASYTDIDSISDSYLLANTPGDYLVEITAVDNNGLVSSAQSTISITDDDTTAPTIDIYYVGSGTHFDPGWWDIYIEDLDSGIEEVVILINEYEYLHENLGGQQSILYLEIYVPVSSGIYSLEVTATNNDNDWVGDQESTSEADTVEISHSDVDPPVIFISIPTVTISDGNAIGGLLLDWEITDESGILQATVKVNGEVIASYNIDESISDSYLLANTPGDYLVEITAVDNIGLVSSAQSTISIVDDDTTAPSIVIQYIGSGTDVDPGWWYVLIGDVESGIDEVQILINGDIVIHDQNLNGQQSISYLEIEVPGSVMVHTIEVFVTNNDTDWDGDQQSASEIATVEVSQSDVDPPVIYISPSSITISDEDALGGVSFDWQITDESGISHATVTLNGEVIATYSDNEIIFDSLHLTNTPDDYQLEITAEDNNGFISSAQGSISIIDDYTLAPAIAIQYFGLGTDVDPGYWHVNVEELGSGIGEVLILVDGGEIVYQVLNGVSSYSYEIPVPAIVGVHMIEVIATNNDNDRNGDQESTSETDTVEIVPGQIIIPGIPVERICIRFSKFDVVQKVPV
ncbi:hypothetical protein CEE45_15960 [Candidatus Heimdallarchaeota archaeon B3_Heim]|nr:MAG: hypothetical protein CEE45_15960 [Candidatus Heimdallarchaeota archaeon B3_Heim]